jgi:hypothetical protein
VRNGDLKIGSHKRNETTPFLVYKREREKKKKKKDIVLLILNV